MIGLALAACHPSTAPADDPSAVVIPTELRPPSAGGWDAETPSLDRATEPSDPPSDRSHLRPGARAGPPSAPVTPGASFGPCLRSPLCRLEGLCSPNDEGLCVAADDDDCKASDACLGGRCTARDGTCVAGSDEDCRQSWACKGWGRCAHDGDAVCIATDEADCRASTRCTREGECVLVGDACAVGP